MTKVNNAKFASEIAQREGLHYGWSVIGGAWFVGTPAQLTDIGAEPQSGPPSARDVAADERRLSRGSGRRRR